MNGVKSAMLRQRNLWLLLAACLLAPGTQARADTLVVTAARMVDVERGRYVDAPQVVVTDGRITAVGRRGDPVPAGARRIDLGSRTLLPGLIDMHVHLTSDPTRRGYLRYRYSDRFWSAVGNANARTMLDNGFTTIRNLGGSHYDDIGLMQAIDEGVATGPRIIGAGYSIGATGGHCDDTYFPPSFERRSPGAADGPEAVRAAVREQRKYGAQVIKVCATGGVFSRNTEPGQQQMREEELRAAAEEAHQWGLKIAAHAHGAAGIKAAIRAGIDTIEHASLIDDEGIRLAKERGTCLSMDIYNSEYTQREGPRNGVLPESIRKDKEIADLQRENFRKAAKAGVCMVFGTDAGVMPHAEAARQFAWMVRYGLNPAEAIRSATWNAAQALGRERDVGAIAPGRVGDIIAVDGDPLADVTALERVAAVIKGGALVKAPPAQ